MADRHHLGLKSLYVEIPAEDDAAVRALAERNGRGVKDEVLHAIRRHLAAPPTVRVEIPELPPAEVEATARPGRGRPRKRG